MARQLSRQAQPKLRARKEFRLRTYDPWCRVRGQAHEKHATQADLSAHAALAGAPGQGAPLARSKDYAHARRVRPTQVVPRRAYATDNACEREARAHPTLVYTVVLSLSTETLVKDETESACDLSLSASLSPAFAISASSGVMPIARSSAPRQRHVSTVAWRKKQGKGGGIGGLGHQQARANSRARHQWRACRSRTEARRPSTRRAGTRCRCASRSHHRHCRSPRAAERPRRRCRGAACCTIAPCHSARQ